MKALIVILSALPGIAFAQMSAEEFDAATRGKVLFYSTGGEDYGVERYMDGRRVEWSFLDGECVEGVWYEEDGQICFAYENWEAPQCWLFRQTPRGLEAEFVSPEGRISRYLALESGEDMVCLGPKTG
ncbi:MAG: hypothetical protein QNJ13_08090, partial [Paracoccaceae bacterium]|nr:hypothetical protein [Paracoccaceae bacterium]